MNEISHAHAQRVCFDVHIVEKGRLLVRRRPSSPHSARTGSPSSRNVTLLSSYSNRIMVIELAILYGDERQCEVAKGEEVEKKTAGRRIPLGPIMKRSFTLPV